MRLTRHTGPGRLAYRRTHTAPRLSHCPTHGHELTGFRVDYHYGPFTGAGLASWQYCTDCTFMGGVTLHKAVIVDDD